MHAVVSDSSPFVYLAALGRFELLRVIYGQVLIPEVVWGEVAVRGGSRPEAELVRQARLDGWVLVVPVVGPVSPLAAKLDAGEQEAILLAQERGALLIIDEARGRAVAEELGVQCVGTLGVLVEAKLRGVIPLLRPELEKLRAETNFRFTEALFRAALVNASETEH